MSSARAAHSPERRSAPAAPVVVRTPDLTVGQVSEIPKSPAQLLAERLAGKLGMDAPPIRTGPAAWKRTESHRTRGLWEEGQIWIDERRVDVGGADGERLMAHELVHAAQARKGGGGSTEAAEAEAWALSLRLMGGDSVRPTLGLGAGQVAAEEPLLQALAYLDKTTQKADSLKGDEPTGKPDVDQLVSSYQDEVAEVLGLLRKEDLFWKLVDAIGTSQEESALAQVRTTGAYHELARQWAVTQPPDGDEKVSSEELKESRRLQQKAYDWEVYFWGNTRARRQAYWRVAEDAKLHPPPAEVAVPDKDVPSLAEGKIAELNTKKKTNARGLSMADALSLAAVARQ